MYSLNHIETLLEIKGQLADGFTLADIKQLMHPRHREPNSDEEVRQMLRDELMKQSRLNQDNKIRQGFGVRP